MSADLSQIALNQSRTALNTAQTTLDEIGIKILAPILSKLSHSPLVPTKVLIFVDKKQHESVEQMEWIKKAKRSFPSVNLSVAFIKDKQKSPIIPPLKSLTSEKKKKHHKRHHKAKISDNKFFKMLHKTKEIDNVFMINHHFDLSFITHFLDGDYDYCMLTSENVETIFKYYQPYFNIKDTKMLTDYQFGFNIDVSKLGVEDASSNVIKPIPQSVFTSFFSSIYIVPEHSKEDCDDDENSSVCDSDDDMEVGDFKNVLSKSNFSPLQFPSVEEVIKDVLFKILKLQ